MVTLFSYLLYNTFFISDSKVYQALHVRHRPTGCDTSVFFFFKISGPIFSYLALGQFCFVIS